MALTADSTVAEKVWRLRWYMSACQQPGAKSLLVAAAHAFASLASIAAASLPGAKEDTVGKSVSAMTRATFCSRVSDIVKG